jgi:ESCRT-I complex subunit VPS28
LVAHGAASPRPPYGGLYIVAIRHDVDSLPTPHNAMNFDEEVRLYTTSAERERTENLSTLYSIIVSLEYLERAYVRDSVTGKE